MSIAGALNSALSGLKASAQSVAVSADNVVNQGSRDYTEKVNRQKSVETRQAADGSYTSGGVQSVIIDTGNEVDVATELVKLTLAKHAYEASAKTLQVADDLSREVLDIKV